MYIIALFCAKQRTEIWRKKYSCISFLDIAIFVLRYFILTHPVELKR